MLGVSLVENTLPYNWIVRGTIGRGTYQRRKKKLLLISLPKKTKRPSPMRL